MLQHLTYALIEIICEIWKFKWSQFYYKGF